MSQRLRQTKVHSQKIQLITINKNKVLECVFFSVSEEHLFYSILNCRHHITCYDLLCKSFMKETLLQIFQDLIYKLAPAIAL